MDFTREPIIETVITPKEGCKLVVRSSKAGGQDEYFVDSVEVVSFGNSVFYRSQERPKAFIVPASDYEVLEVREARMVLKNVGLDRSIKIGGGRESHAKSQKEQQPEKAAATLQEASATEASVQPQASLQPQAKQEKGQDGRKKDRRRQYRRRSGRENGLAEEESEASEETPLEGAALENASLPGSVPNAPINVLLPPPPMLISETIARYKDNALFKSAFYTKEEAIKEILENQIFESESGSIAEAEKPTIQLAQPEYGSFEATEAEEEAIYRERTHQPFLKEDDDLPSTLHFGEEQFPEKDYSHPHRDE
ncbi:MAG TPA: hypothetical protein PLC42_00130 [Parachlamydiaceae bacterium]|nr:hypothetical protein [Parachlamydiaceae bacterium]